MLRIGDKVKIRDDLKEGEIYCICKVTKGKLCFAGENATITGIKTYECKDYYILSVSDKHFWTEEMFEKEKKDKIKNKNNIFKEFNL